MAENRIGIKILANRAGLSYKDTKRLLYDIWMNSPRAASAARTLAIEIGGRQHERPRAVGRKTDLIIMDDIEEPTTPQSREKILEAFKGFWYGRRDSNPHAIAPDFKSGMSTSSITPAVKTIPSTEDIIDQSIADVIAAQKCAKKCASGARRVPYGHF